MRADFAVISRRRPRSVLPGAVKWPASSTRDCAETDDIRELNTALGISTKVAEPKDEHGGEEGAFGRARCVDDLVTLRHQSLERLSRRSTGSLR